MNRLFRTLVSFVAAVSVTGPVVSSVLAPSAGASSVSYQATQSFTPPSSTFAGASGGGDGWATASYSGRVYNVFHHQAYLGLMCHNESDASACWTTSDTGGANLYKTITAQVNGVNQAFATSGKDGLYVDQATGLLYVYAIDIANSQPGVVCVNLKALDTVSDPVCSGSGGQPPAWTPLAAPGDTGWTSSNPYSGTMTPTFYGGELFAWNPVNGQKAGLGAGGATGPSGAGKNTLLCYDIATQAPCASEPFAVTVSANTQATNNDLSPSPATTLVGSDLYIPTSWSTGGVVACVDLSLSTPGNCAGSWPQPMSVSSQSFVIPSLDSAGTPTGVCGLNSSSVWSCWGFDGSVQPTPSGLTSSVLTTWQWSGSPVVVGTRVYQVMSTPQIDCYDFATNAACTTTSGYFPLPLSSINSPYTVTPDAQRPTCIWINGDSGNNQIQNFDALTGGSCANAPVRVFASSFVEPYQSCTPTSFNSITLTSGNFVTSPPPTLSFTNGNGVVIDGPYSFSSGASPTIDLTSLTYPTPIDLSTQSALPQFVLNLTPGNGGLGTVSVQVTWSGSQLSQCTPGYAGPAPSTSAASSVLDTSARFNGSVDNTSSDVVNPVQFCYQTTSFTSGNCTGTTVTAQAGTPAATVTPYTFDNSNLSRSTTYYYELVATDSTTHSPLYGGVESFSTGPTATTGPVSSLSDTGATLNGSLYNPGGDSFSSVQFCYQTTSFASGACAGTPVTATAGSSSPAGTQYSLPLSGLTAGATYYYELVATNSTTPGTSFGGVRQFIAAPVTSTSAATSVGNQSATFNGTVYNPSTDQLNASYCYATSAFTSGNCATVTGHLITAAAAGTTVAFTTPFSAVLSSLSPGTTYYFELVVSDTTTNLTYYGGVRSVTTGPIVTTASALNVRPSTATLVGTVYNPAADSFSAVQFCYQTTSFVSGTCGATPVAATAGTTSSSTTEYTLALTSLIPGHTYYYEIVGTDSTNSSHQYDGGVRQFIAGPIVTTQAPTSLGATSATLTGTLLNPNAMSIGSAQFCYQTSSFASGACSGTTVAATTSTASGGASTYSANLAGLTTGISYYYELEITPNSSSSPYYGGVESFQTNQPPAGPSLPSSPVGLIVTQTGTTAIANWSVPSSDGGATIEGYVCTLIIGSTVMTHVQTTSTSCSFPGVGAPNTYSVGVLAFNVVGQGPTAYATAPTGTGIGTGPAKGPGAGTGTGRTGTGTGTGTGIGTGPAKGPGAGTGTGIGTGTGPAKGTGIGKGKGSVKGKGKGKGKGSIKGKGSVKGKGKGSIKGKGSVKGKGKGKGKGSIKGKGSVKGKGKGSIKGKGSVKGKGKGKGKGNGSIKGKGSVKGKGKGSAQHGSTFLVARWPSAAMNGLGRNPTYDVVLTPSSRSCLTQQTSCRFNGLNSAIHYTYRVTAAIEIVPFAENSYSLIGAPLQQANALLRLIVRFHPSAVVLAGYTDAYGSTAYNAILSFERTHSVGAYVTASLKAMKVTMPKLVYLAFGESHPVAPNSSIAVAAGNRRVEVTFYLP